MKLITPTSVGVLAYLLACPVIAQSQAAGNCTVFNWDQQPGYIVSDSRPMRVSAAITCPERNTNNETHFCPITAAGDVPGKMQFQTAVQNSYWGATSFLEETVLRTVNGSLQGALWSSRIATIDTTQTLEAGSSAYLNFTLYLRCFEGTMAGCTGGLQDGIPIRACASVYTPVRSIQPTLPILAGEYAVVQIPEESVSQYRNPFAGMVRGDAQCLRGGAAMALLTTALSFIVWAL